MAYSMMRQKLLHRIEGGRATSHMMTKVWCYQSCDDGGVSCYQPYDNGSGWSCQSYDEVCGVTNGIRLFSDNRYKRA